MRVWSWQLRAATMWVQNLSQIPLYSVNWVYGSTPTRGSVLFCSMPILCGREYLFVESTCPQMGKHVHFPSGAVPIVLVPCFAYLLIPGNVLILLVRAPTFSEFPRWSRKSSLCVQSLVLLFRTNSICLFSERLVSRDVTYHATMLVFSIDVTKKDTYYIWMKY